MSDTPTGAPAPAAAPNGGPSADQLLQRLKDALYDAKRVSNNKGHVQQCLDAVNAPAGSPGRHITVT